MEEVAACTVCSVQAHSAMHCAMEKLIQVSAVLIRLPEVHVVQVNREAVCNCDHTDILENCQSCALRRGSRGVTFLSEDLEQGWLTVHRREREVQYDLEL